MYKSLYVRILFHGQISRSGMAESYSKCIYKFLRKCQTILHSDFKILHLYWQDISVPAAALGVF